MSDSYYNGKDDEFPDNDVGIALTSDEMVGDAAVENKEAFDFDVQGNEVWFSVSGGDRFNPTATEDGYLILQAIDSEPQLEAQGITGDLDHSPAEFSVEIIRPDDGEEVSKNETLDVEVDVTNIGGEEAEKMVELTALVETEKT